MPAERDTFDSIFFPCFQRRSDGDVEKASGKSVTC